MEKENLIEEFFCVPFEKLQKQPMTEETSKIFYYDVYVRN